MKEIGIRKQEAGRYENYHKLETLNFELETRNQESENKRQDIMKIFINLKL